MSGALQITFMNQRSFAAPFWIGQLKGSGQTSNSFGVSVDSDKNVYLVGNNNNSGQTAKYDPAGVIQSQTAVINALNSNITRDIAIDSSKNTYTINYHFNGSLGVGFLFVTKYNPSGVRQWTRRFTNLNSTFDPPAVTVDSSANVYVSASWNNTGGYYISIIKLDTSGNVVWQRRVDSGTQDLFLNTSGNIAVDASGNVHFSGTYWNTISGSQEIYLVKLDSNGNNVWQRTLGGGGTQQGRGAAIDSSGNVYVFGNATSGPFVVLAKYNSSGTLQWQRELSFGGLDIQAANVTVDTSGNPLICGRVRIANSPTLVVGFIVKYNTSGTIQWQRRLGPNVIGGRTTTTLFNDIFSDSSGDIYASGYSDPVAQNETNFFFAKIPSDGSKTGTYTLAGVNYNYVASSLSEGAAAYEGATVNLTVNGTSFSTDTTSLTEAASSLTSTVTTL